MTELMMRAHSAGASASLEWIVDALSDEGAWTGYDMSGWEDSIWLLHAMWERPSDGVAITTDQERKAGISAGFFEPQVVGGIDLDQETTLTGVPLGFTGSPGHGWTRLLWHTFADRLGIALGAGQSYPPASKWFGIRSWPINIRPPGEGSLDSDSFRALLKVLASHARDGVDTACHAFFGRCLCADIEHDTVYDGPLKALPETVNRPDSVAATTPSNIWPDDRSWFVYTDWDLWATRVSGPRELIHRLELAPELETVRWTRPETR